MKTDIYQSITDTIVAAIEQDVGDPIMPWHRGGADGVPVNIQTKHYYQGINILNLWVTSQIKHYTTNIWGTYRQWMESGAQVRKGEKSSIIVFYKQWTAGEGDEEKQMRVLRYSAGFNADQVDGYESSALNGDPVDRDKLADEYVANTGASITIGGPSAYYDIGNDAIHMPDEERFFATKTSSRTESYYNVLLHELTHWSGAKHRLDRDMGKRFGDAGYSMEELVAELGSAFQCSHLGITPEPRLDHAQYIAHWLKVLKSDKKAIFTASARAQEAVIFLGGQHG